MKKVIAVLFLLFSFSGQVVGATNASECSAMKQHFNSVSAADQRRLVNSCEEVFTPGVGWTNSATGCGRCPSSSSFCESAGSACARVEMLEGLKGAVSDWTQSKNDQYLREAYEKVKNLEMIFISETPEVTPQVYAPTVLVLPEVGRETSVGVDEAITSSYAGFYAECVVPLIGYAQKKMGGYLHTLVENAPLCKLRSKDKVFHGNYFNKIKQETGMPSAAFPYSIKEKKKGLDICQREMGMSFACSKKNPKENFIFGLGFVANIGSTSDGIWYRGGDASNIFIETIDNDVTRKFIHNLASGSVFSCGEYSLKIKYADGDVLTFERKSGAISDLANDCVGEIFGTNFVDLSTQEKASPIERLERLLEMRDMGLLSEQEFEAKRLEIVEQL